ncbi:Hypothetical predicted protein, partial [Paramuricea clavata]
MLTSKRVYYWNGSLNELKSFIEDNLYDEENPLSNAFKGLAITEEVNFGNCDVESDREVVNKTLESCEGCSKSDNAVADLQGDVVSLKSNTWEIVQQLLKVRSSTRSSTRSSCRVKEFVAD